MSPAALPPPRVLMGGNRRGWCGPPSGHVPHPCFAFGLVDERRGRLEPKLRREALGIGIADRKRNNRPGIAKRRGLERLRCLIQILMGENGAQFLLSQLTENLGKALCGEVLEFIHDQEVRHTVLGRHHPRVDGGTRHRRVGKS